MKKEWKKFERIVAAIHMVENSGATVTWNEDINGRQFDVVIRFKVLFYYYLTLVECKDYKTPVEVGEVEAFVTKSRDAGAQKSVVVSSSGFQSGAKEVAARHNIELYTLTETEDLPDRLFNDIISVLVVWPVGFRKANGEILYLSQDPAILTDQINNTRMIGFGNQKLIDILNPYSQLLAPFDIPGVPKFGGDFPVATKKQQNQALRLAIGTQIVLPSDNKPIPVSELLISYWMQDVRLQPMLDLTVLKNLSKKYQYKNELTEESKVIDPSTLPIGFDTKFEAGKFYTQPSIKFSYYCESLDEKEAKIYLVESYQYGQLIQGRTFIPLGEAKYFVEITDPKEIARLRPMYESGKKIEASYLEKQKKPEK